MHTSNATDRRGEKNKKAQSRPQNRNVPEHPDFRHTDHRENYLPSNQSAHRIIKKSLSLDEGEEGGGV
jgi:hypothetical protein